MNGVRKQYERQPKYESLAKVFKFFEFLVF